MEDNKEQTAKPIKEQVLEYDKLIHFFANKIWSEPHEDVVQEMYLYIFRYIDAYNPKKGTLKNWIVSACKSWTLLYLGYNNPKRVPRSDYPKMVRGVYDHPVDWLLEPVPDDPADWVQVEKDLAMPQEILDLLASDPYGISGVSPVDIGKIFVSVGTIHKETGTYPTVAELSKIHNIPVRTVSLALAKLVNSGIYTDSVRKQILRFDGHSTD